MNHKRNCENTHLVQLLRQRQVQQEQRRWGIESSRKRSRPFSLEAGARTSDSAVGVDSGSGSSSGNGSGSGGDGDGDGDRNSDYDRR